MAARPQPHPQLFTCYDDPIKKAQRYGDHEERVAKAIKGLKEIPESKMKHVATHYGLDRDTLP